jgi:CTP:molybdopterin cytidylyltransferase MocA
VIAGLILAAGAGTRFGDAPKLLADLDGRPLLEHAIRAHCSVPELQRVVVVLGANAAGLLAAVDFDHAEPLICEDWRDGQSASLRAGVEELAGAAKVVVTLGDEPLVTSEVVLRLLRSPAPARAVYEGRPGHPVVLGPEQLRAVGSLTGDHGAREMLGEVREVECSDLCSGRDVDTRADLEAIRDEARAIL